MFTEHCRYDWMAFSRCEWKIFKHFAKKLKFSHRKTHKATEDDVKTMLEGKVPSTSTAKCTTTCVMQQFKVVRWIFNKKSRGKTDLVQLSFPIGQEKWSNQVSRGRLWDMFKISWSKWCRQRENGHWKRSLWKMQSSWYHWWVSLKKKTVSLYTNDRWYYCLIFSCEFSGMVATCMETEAKARGITLDSF